MPATQTVLIVDRSEETQEVLRTVLERRGLRIYSASRAGRGLELARQHHPDLIVLDLEVEDVQPEEISASFARQTGEGETALVMLGSIRRSGSGLPGGQIIAKPYHYGPLIRKIEAVLERSRPGVA